MQRKTVSIMFIALLFGSSFLLLREIRALEGSEVEFETISRGDMSGYVEEGYMVLRTETELTTVWERHTAPFIPLTSPPEVDFSERMVVCAFMGKQPTTGYTISVRRIWIEEQRLYVDIIKRSPSKDIVVAEMLTFPFIFVSLNRTDLEVMFSISDEGRIPDELPEFGTIIALLSAFTMLSAIFVLLKNRRQKKLSGC